MNRRKWSSFEIEMTGGVAAIGCSLMGEACENEDDFQIRDRRRRWSGEYPGKQ
jgi:hypothetical protein